MKYLFTLVLLAFFTVACKQKTLSGKELEDKLKETMTVHLRSTLEPGVEFKVNDLVFYPDKIRKLYLCEFKVHMHFGNRDTTGIVKATISSDFKDVVRSQ